MDYILTAVGTEEDNRFTPHAYEFVRSFIISLRANAKYEGEIILFMYSDDVPKDVENLCKKFDVKVKNVSVGDGSIFNYRFDEFNKFLEGCEEEDRFFIYDIDIWFNDNPSKAKELENGCLFATDIPNIGMTSWLVYEENMNKPELKGFLSREERMIKEYGGILNCGMIFGKKLLVGKKLKGLVEALRINKYGNEIGVDQLYFNLTFDFENDSLEGSFLNFLITKPARDLSEVTGIHVVTSTRTSDQFFKDFHPEIWAEHCAIDERTSLALGKQL